MVKRLVPILIDLFNQTTKVRGQITGTKIRIDKHTRADIHKLTQIYACDAQWSYLGSPLPNSLAML